MSGPCNGASLVTTPGPKRRGGLGMILQHEHGFLDLRTWENQGHGESEVVEPTTLGVGRRVDVLKAVSEATGTPLAAPTSVYREPWIPAWVYAADAGRLRDHMVGELLEGIEDTGVRAGWIKVSAGYDGLTVTETKVLRAAAKAALTGAAVGSHTVRGRVALDQLDVLEEGGLPPDRFVWIHAQRVPNVALHRELADRRACLEYDGIGRRRIAQGPDDRFVYLVRKALDAALPRGGR